MASGPRIGLLAAVGAAALVACVALHQLWWPPEPAAAEIGVFYPGSSGETWTDFVRGVELAAREEGASFEAAPDGQSCLVKTRAHAVRFRWYPEVGGRGIQRRIAEICRRRDPPLAIVGANNSALTLALAHELALCERPDQTPVLLMTTATADGLVDILPGRSFRFGASNARQAATLVERLKAFYRQRDLDPSNVSAVVFEVADDPFSIDLARDLAERVREELGASFLAPPRQFEGNLLGGPANTHAWSLSTSTGGFDEPTAEERRLAEAVVRELLGKPDRQWVLVLPIGATPFRRLSLAMTEALASAADRKAAQQVRKNIVVLSGDSMDYYDFLDAQRNQILPGKTIGPVFFFAHTNPIDRSVASAPDPSIPQRGLARDVARAVLAALPSAEERPSPPALAAALARLTPPGETTAVFVGGERRTGGGAIVAIPEPGEGRFAIELPPAWRSDPSPAPSGTSPP